MSTMTRKGFLATAAGLSGLALAACGGTSTGNDNNGSGDTGANTAEEALPYGDEGREAVKLSAFSQLANWSGAQAGWSGTMFKDMFNVDITIIPDTNGAMSTRMSSGDLGDIVVFGANGDDYHNAVDGGLLFPWEDEDLLATYGPYIDETFEKPIEANRELNSDGEVYGIGHNVALSADEH